ncbi:MAG: RluA family pseudouridine synthase [Saprospiraceae bacterium]
MQITESVLYKNKQLIAFNKPAGLPTQSDRSGDKALLDIAEIYTKSPLFLIHRLDRPATGIVLLARTKKGLAILNEQFQKRTIKKTYLAVVKNHPPEKEGTLIHYMLKSQKKNRAFAHDEEKPNSKKAELTYKVIASIDNYHLLEINLVTGRHHQIRAQLAQIDCPIKGDERYGFKRGNKDRSIHLHAWKLEFRHPVTNDVVKLEAPIPEEVVWQAFDF